MPAAFAIRSYAVREAHGYVFLWWGEDDASGEPDLPAVPWFSRLEEGDYRYAGFVSE